MSEEDEPDAFVVEPISKEDWEQREVYANFGLAIYFCQVMEAQLVNYLALLRRMKTGRPMPEEEVDALFDRLFSGTFGRNLKEVRDLLGEDWLLAKDMTVALKLRNGLVHHWMRDRALDQGTSAKRLAMIEELKEAHVQLQEADQKLTARSKGLWDKAGMDWGWLEQEYKRLSEIAETDDAEEAP